MSVANDDEVIGSNYSIITNHLKANPIKKTKELLCFVTINPFKEAKSFKSWQKIGKCSDYFRKHSRCFFVVRGTNPDKTYHYHIICYLSLDAIVKIGNSKQFNIDIKKRTAADKVDFSFPDIDDEFNSAQDELIDSKTQFTDQDVWILIGYKRARRDLILQNKKTDKYLIPDLSKYMYSNLFKNTDSTSSWLLYENYMLFPKKR